MSLTLEDDQITKARSITAVGQPKARKGTGTDLWWQRSVRPVAAAIADPPPRPTSEMLPTVLVGAAIILFKLFMLGLLIYSL